MEATNPSSTSSSDTSEEERETRSLLDSNNNNNNNRKEKKRSKLRVKFKPDEVALDIEKLEEPERLATTSKAEEAPPQGKAAREQPEEGAEPLFSLPPNYGSLNNVESPQINRLYDALAKDEAKALRKEGRYRRNRKGPLANIGIIRESEGELVDMTPKEVRKARRENRLLRKKQARRSRPRLEEQPEWEAEEESGSKEEEGSVGEAAEGESEEERRKIVGEPHKILADIEGPPTPPSVAVALPPDQQRTYGSRHKDEPEPLTRIDSRNLDEERYPSADEKYERDEEDFTCLVARSCLILPFKYSETQKDSLFWIERLKRRVVINSNNQQIHIWKDRDQLPREVGDLTTQFRQVLGWRDRNKPSISKTWTCRRLVLTEEAHREFFPEAWLNTLQGDTSVNVPVVFESIEVLFYPLGSAFLLVHLNWVPKRPDGSLSQVTLHDVRTLLFVSKHRYKTNGITMGWGIGSEPDSDQNQPSGCSEWCFPAGYRECLGEEFFHARYSGKTISLNDLGNWLLATKEEANCLPLRLEYGRTAHHHSTVVVDREPPRSILSEYLFNLRRAFGQKNRPPPHSETSLGKVLIWRINRYVGISREGTICISWPLTKVESWNDNWKQDFEVSSWYQKFQGIYLMLELHVHGEKLVFYELSDMAAVQAEQLAMISKSSNFEEMKASRNQLRELASLLTQYTLSMSNNDCGGVSEYSEFFTNLRKVFGIPELRNELSTELKDVLAVVESNYLEVERMQRDKEEEERRATAEAQRRVQKERDLQNQQFDLMLSVLSSITLPYVLVASVFGMNLKNLPVSVDFWTLMGVTFAISVLMLILMLVARFRKFKGLQDRIIPFDSHHRTHSLGLSDLLDQQAIEEEDRMSKNTRFERAYQG